MKWILFALVTLPVLGVLPMIGLLLQPFGMWYVAGKNAQAPAIIGDLPATDPGDLQPILGIVSDAQRFQLARQAGWSFNDAITATAISIAENGTGNPAAMSPRNRDGSYDLGMWQINSGWWSRFGGQQALADPWRNAQAAFTIYGIQGWCAWSTYGPCQAHSCGPPCYRDYLSRATAASRVQPDPRQG